MNLSRKYLVLFLIFFFVDLSVFAQDLPPPPGDLDPEELPIDDHIWLLGGIGLLYVFSRYRVSSDSHSR